MKTRILVLVGTSCLALGLGAPALAQTAYLGEITLTAGGSCNAFQMEPNGQVLQISEHTALYTLIGCTFGGDCEETFALPNMQQRSPFGMRDFFPVGQAGGSFEGTLPAGALPEHTHTFNASPTPATLPNPAGADLAEFETGGLPAYCSEAPSRTLPMATEAVSPTGEEAPFDLTQPSLVTRFCIKIAGPFPPINNGEGE